MLLNEFLGVCHEEPRRVPRGSLETPQGSPGSPGEAPRRPKGIAWSPQGRPRAAQGSPKATPEVPEAPPRVENRGLNATKMNFKPDVPSRTLFSSDFASKLLPKLICKSVANYEENFAKAVIDQGSDVARIMVLPR